MAAYTIGTLFRCAPAQSPGALAGIRRASRPRLVLFTPVPPVKSGTADYVGALLDVLPPSLLQAYRIVCAVNTEHNTRLLFERCPLVDAATCVLEPGDVA